MAPSDYIAARSNGDKDDQFYQVLVDERPYFPFLVVDASKEDSIRLAASLIVNDTKDFDSSNLKVTKISGGITNQLYRVSGLANSTNGTTNTSAVLVRLFGAEGMIDRNVENATYASLAKKGLAPKYYGRFANGRLEEWLEARPLDVEELSVYSKPIAHEMGHLHANFKVPSHLEQYHNTPALWTDLHSWMTQALNATFACEKDTERAAALNLEQVAEELKWLEQDMVPANAETCFCHNDVLAANILKLDDKDSIQLIDFEYGGINYKAFDLANHFNEYAGGTDTGKPNYDLAPSLEQQRDFIQHYLEACGDCEDNVEELLQQVHSFILVNHLYWGLWAVNQASTEGCEDFDYLLYASNRIGQYYKCQQQQQDGQDGVSKS